MSDELKQVLELKPSTPVTSPKDQAEADGVWTQFLKRTDQPNDPAPRTMSAAPMTPPSILSYFGLPPTKISAETEAQLQELGLLVLPDTHDPDEFFHLLRAAERHLPKISDPKIRLTKLLETLRTMRQQGSVREQLVASGAYHLDQLEAEAEQTGNWSRYLAAVQRHEEALR